ncbi:non-homologous end-joining DNA ligase [Lysobacter sp. A6]|uniref:Non-homologous end-joining DNA ligase n=1 Tax=Noviluteimonas lactosilytica TaxID=2888523 RepID=A0ABS8JL80_9GAMM|nr:non-homologous end-joining DNA ligase [Lysobacter lactosilyticus]MCC8364368.1 non-homologous end-joining DNA ligase [Lysobacter lactosilyticus]
MRTGTASATASRKTTRPTLSSPDRVVYPDAGITKRDVFEYYEAVADRLIEDAGDRLMSVVRCPDGIDGERFFQKHLGPAFKSLHRMEIAENDGKRAQYAWLDDLAGVLSLAQMNVVEFHPWGSRVKTLEKPDRLIFDLDPDEGMAWPKIKAAARELRDTLAEFELQSFPRLTGGKGVHLVVPIARRYAWDQAREFADRFAHAMEARAPARYVATMSKAKREGRIFIDWLRNGRGATAVASWSLRARKGAPVAMPVTWDEFARVRSADRFKLRDAMKRVDAPIWDYAGARDQRLPKAADLH